MVVWLIIFMEERYMTIKMLLFDYRDSEKNFFKNRNFENFDITFFSESLNEDTVKTIDKNLLEQTTVISVFIDSEVTKDVINAFKNLRIISTRSTGIDHINHKYAMEKNIDVINVESYGATSVAQYTIGLMIALVRKIIPASRYVLTKENSCQSFIGRDISKLTIGIVGTGSIGAAVCKLASGFGMKVFAYDIAKKQELCNKTTVEYTDLETLIKQSDIISLHLPYTGENYHMFSTLQFEQMKRSTYFINTSRGELLDTTALYDAIIDNKIQGAALDVVSCEAYSFKCNQFSRRLGEDITCMKEAELVGKLSKMPNVIITPHIAYETQDAVEYLLEMSFRGIVDTIKGGNQFRNL